MACAHRRIDMLYPAYSSSHEREIGFLKITTTCTHYSYTAVEDDNDVMHHYYQRCSMHVIEARQKKKQKTGKEKKALTTTAKIERRF